MKLAFTGHRPESLPFGDNEMSPLCLRLKAMLLNEIIDRAKSGYDTFYCGAARGADLIYARQVLLARTTEYPNIKLVCVVPFAGQANGWSEKLKLKRELIKSLISRIIELAKGGVDMSETVQMATATEVQNNFGKYLQLAIDKGEVVILRNGKRVARIVSDQSAVSYLTDSLRGVLKGNYSDESARSERMKKYENID